MDLTRGHCVFVVVQAIRRNLWRNIAVRALEPFITKDLVLERFVPFRLLEVEGLEKAVKGLPADLMIDVCQGFVAALQASFDPSSPYPKLTDHGDEGKHVFIRLRKGRPRGVD